MPRGLRRALLIAAIAGGALRMAFAFGYWTDKPLTRDEREYLSLARGVASGRGLTYDEDVTSGGPSPFGRAPGYPVWLALVGGGRAPGDTVPATVKAAQSVIGMITIWLIGAIAWRAGGRRAATVAAWIAALYPPLIWVGSYALSEAVFLPVGLAAVWLFDRSTRETGGIRVGTALVCGLTVGVALLVRPAMLFFLLVAIPWLLWRRRAALAIAIVVSAMLVVLPWTIRNYARYHRVVLVASEGGVTFWTGNHPLARGEGDLAANPDLKRANAALRAQYPALSEEDMEPVYYREAFAWIRAEPWRWLTLESKKMFYLVVPSGPSYTLHSRLYDGTSVASYGLLMPFALAGAIRLGRRRARVEGLWLLLASTVVMSLVFFPQERFRIPVIDPVMIICASMLVMSPEDAAA